MKATNPNLVRSESRKSWVPVLEQAACEVFERMMGSPLTSLPDSFAEEGLDITAMVGIAGHICGVLTIRCTATCAALMASKMLGVDADQAGPEMLDAVGEVCNMIAGNFKTKIADMGDGCMLSVPTVIRGADYSLHALADSGKLETYWLFEALPLIVSIEIDS